MDNAASYWPCAICFRDPAPDRPLIELGDSEAPFEVCIWCIAERVEAVMGWRLRGSFKLWLQMRELGKQQQALRRAERRRNNTGTADTDAADHSLAE